MCGRYTLTQLPDNEVLVDQDGEVLDWEPRYNIAPTNWCPVKTMQQPDILRLYRWGLIPSWAEDEKIGYRTINARAETLASKPSFRDSFVRSRCLVYADGFFEWKKSGKAKQPYRILANGGKPFTMAGLSARWSAPDGTVIDSFTIITTKPNQLTAQVHDRMPVILDSAAAALWLRYDTPPVALGQLLIPYPADAMSLYPVDNAVGNVRNDHKELISKKL